MSTTTEGSYGWNATESLWERLIHICTAAAKVQRKESLYDRYQRARYVHYAVSNGITA